MPRRGRFAIAHQRDRVRRVVEHPEVGDRVLDLGALVEPRPADHLVRDALRERERPRAPATARSCGRRRRAPRPTALLDRARDLRRDEARLGVLVLDLDDLDRLALAELATRAASACGRGCCRSPRWRRSRIVVRRAVVLLERDRSRRRESRARSRGCCGCRPRARRRSTDRGRRRRIRFWCSAGEQLAGTGTARGSCPGTRRRGRGGRRAASASRRPGSRSKSSTVSISRSSKSTAFEAGEPRLVERVDLGDRLVPERRDAGQVLVGRDQRVLRVRDLVVDPARGEALRVLAELLEARPSRGAPGRPGRRS